MATFKLAAPEHGGDAPTLEQMAFATVEIGFVLVGVAERFDEKPETRELATAARGIVGDLARLQDRANVARHISALSMRTLARVYIEVATRLFDVCRLAESDDGPATVLDKTAIADASRSLCSVADLVVVSESLL